MQPNFDRCLSLVLKSEGGFVNDPRDPGGATNKGITLANFRRYVKRGGTVADLKAISDADIAKVYRKHYWNAVSGDELPSGVDYAVFDFAVNSGPTRAAKFLQRVLAVPVDGKIGSVTLDAAKRLQGSFVIIQLCNARMAFLRRLSTFATFGKGWTRRVDSVKADALAMVHAPAQAPKPIPAPKAPETPKPASAPSYGGLAGILAAIIGIIAKLFGKK